MLSIVTGLFLLLPAGPFPSDSVTERLVLQAPGKAWSVSVAPPGFEFGTPETSTTGRIWGAGDSLEPGLSLVVFLEQGERDASACLEARLGRRRAVERYSRGALEVAELALEEYNGARIDRRQLAVASFREGVCVHVELTKLDFVSEDRKFFEQLLDSIEFIEAAMEPEAPER